MSNDRNDFESYGQCNRTNYQLGAERGSSSSASTIEREQSELFLTELMRHHRSIDFIGIARDLLNSEMLAWI